MEDEAIPMEAVISYEDDGGLEDDSSSQSGLMTTDKIELELKPRRLRTKTLFDPTRSLSLGDLMLGVNSTTPTDSSAADGASGDASPAHDLQAHLMDHTYSSGDGPSISMSVGSAAIFGNNKRKSSPQDAAQKKSRLDFAEMPR